MANVVRIASTYTARISEGVARNSLLMPGTEVKFNEHDLEKPRDTVVIRRNGGQLSVCIKFLEWSERRQSALQDEIDSVRARHGIAKPEKSKKVSSSPRGLQDALAT